MPDQQGMPIWEKIQVVDAEGITGLMIPLSHDNETMSSVLFAALDEKNSVVGVKDYDNDLLKKIVYEEKIDVKFRESIFYTFMFVDNKTFGTQEFTGLPKDIFIGKKYDDKYGRIAIKDFTEPKTITVNETGKVLFVEYCGSYWSCTHHGEGSCDHCSACYTTSCSTMVISVADEPFPGTPGSGSPGGGGPPSGPEGNIPSDDPCGSASTVFYRLAPGCGGSGNPDFPEIEPPKTNCETLKQLNEQDLVKDAIADLKTKTTGKVEFAYEIYRNGQNFSTNLRYGNETGTMVSTGDDIKGQAHNHPESGMSIPSIGDIKWLRDCKENVTFNANAYNIVVCHDPANPTNISESIVYAIMVDDLSILNIKVNDLWNRPDLVDRTDAEKYKILLSEFSDAFADVQDSSLGMEKRFIERYTSFGISLYKQDKTTKDWDKLIVENNIVKPIPCP